MIESLTNLPNYALCLFCTQTLPIEDMESIILNGRKMLVCQACYDQLGRGVKIKPDLSVLNMYTFISAAGSGDIQQQMQIAMVKMRRDMEQVMSNPITLIPYVSQLTTAVGSHGEHSKEEMMEIFDWFWNELARRCGPERDG